MSWLDSLRRYGAVTAAAWALEKARPRLAPRTADELAFLPAALEIVETPPAPAGRAVAWAIMGFFTLAVVWASLGEVDIHATAQGQVIPRGKTKQVQPPEPGVVKEILVQDGDGVAAGDVLVVLDQTGSAADVTRLKRERAEALAAMARLRAQKEGRGELAPAGEVPPEVLAVHRQQLQARLREQRALLDGLQREREQKLAEREALRADEKGLEEALRVIREILAMRSELEKSGSGSRLKLLEVRQSEVERVQALASTRHKLVQAQAAIAAAEERRRQAEEQFSGDTLRDLAEAERKAETLEAELAKAAQRDTLLKLRAPVDGVVQQLTVHAPGAVVNQGQAVLAVVPTGEGIDAEVILANKDVGFVHQGQPVEVKVETFPFTRYGTLPGTVLTISRDAIQTQGQAQGHGAPGQAADQPQTPIYAVRVRLERETLMVNGQPETLTPGMAVTAEIKTGRRRLIDYLLAPLLKYRDESLREM